MRRADAIRRLSEFSIRFSPAPYQKFLKIKPSSIGIVLAHY
jgi:hypothetical protein